MKINNSQGIQPADLERSSETASASGIGGNASAKVPSLAGDQLQLSNLTGSLSSVLGESAVHLQNLSSLASVVLNGGYRVDARTVSDSILRHSLQFGGANYV